MHQDILTDMEMSDIFPAKHTVFRQDMFITHHLFAAFPLFFVNKVADQKIKCIHTAGQLSQLFQNGEIGIFFYPVVTVYDFKINSGRIFNSGVDRRAVSAVFLMDRLYDRRIFCRIFVCDFGGVVLRTVVDNQNLNILSPRKQRFDAMCHIILRIIAGNCNRKQFHSVVPFIFWIPV